MIFPKSLQKWMGDDRQAVSATTSSIPQQASWRKYLPELILFAVCILPALFFSSRALQEPWTMFRIARAELSLQAGRMETYVTAAAGYRAEHIGGEMMQAALIQATGLSLESIGLLPIGALLLAITYYGLVHTVSGSRLTAVLITLYASFYYPRLYSQYATQTYVWTNILFLNFLLLLFLWVRHRTPALSILMTLIFVATFLHYQTTPIWIIIAIAVAVIGMGLRAKSEKSASTHISWALPFFCIVLYLQFDTVIYGNGLARLKNDAVNESFVQSVVNKIIAPLFARSPESLDPFAIAPINPRIATWSTLAVLLLLTIPIGIWGLQQIKKIIMTRKISSVVQQSSSIFVWVVIFTAIGHAILYSFYGALSLRVIPLAFPLLIPIVAKSWSKSRQIEHGWSFALAAFAIIGFSSFAPTFLPDKTAAETGIAANLLQSQSQVLSDPNVYGSLLLNAADRGEILDYVWPTPDLYRSLVGQMALDTNSFDYFVADNSGKPVTTTGWGNLRPWSEYLDQIGKNELLNKTYDNGEVQLFQSIRVPLSSYQFVQSDVDTNVDKWGDALWLFLGIGGLFLIPGGILLFLIQKLSGFMLPTPFAFWGISLGVSISLITFVGYFVNFSSLMLDWQVAFVVILPIILLLGYGVFLGVRGARRREKWGDVLRDMISRRPARTNLSRHFGFILGAVLILWSLLAANVGGNRIAGNLDYVEFFVTQGEAAGEVQLNVVSRLDEEETFTVAMLGEDGEAIVVDDAVRIEPNGFWQGAILMTDEPLHVLLQRDGEVYRDVWLRGQ